jgi:hypothetical protein
MFVKYSLLKWQTNVYWRSNKDQAEWPDCDRILRNEKDKDLYIIIIIIIIIVCSLWGSRSAEYEAYYNVTPSLLVEIEEYFRVSHFPHFKVKE